MKSKLSIIATILALVLAQTAAALTMQEIINGQGQVLGASTNGLVGYWKFDDASGTTAADSSAIIIRLHSAMPPGRRKINRGAVSFNGSNSVVNLPANFPNLSDFTVSAWINSQSVAGNHMVWQPLTGEAILSWSRNIPIPKWL